jgi:hypothetical protein
MSYTKYPKLWTIILNNFLKMCKKSFAQFSNFTCHTSTVTPHPLQGMILLQRATLVRSKTKEAVT